MARRLRACACEKGLGQGGWASFHAAGTGKNSRDKSRARLPAAETSPSPSDHPWMGRGKKKWGRKSGRNNLEETFPGLLRISFLFPHSLPPFRCFLRNHCLPPLPTCVPYLFYIRYDKKSRLFPGQILYRSLTILSIPTRVIKFSTILHKLIPSKFLSQFFSKCFSTFLEIFRF